MDLGKAALRRTGCNVLQCALHPKHGLAWTDGQCVYLASVRVVDDEVENDTSLKLGEFESVEGLHWSSDLSGYCYLCVIHQSTVSIWKVDGTSPDLNLKQVRKINACPISQGCLWNPKRDILCILSKDQCGFYFRHTQNKGSYALPPIESGRISCGCWAAKGSKLVVGIGSILLVYQWADIDKSISDYTIIAWKIPSVDGRICAIGTVSEDRLVCSAELPLDTLCKVHTQGMLATDMSSEEENSSQSENGEDVLKPRRLKTLTHKDKLLNLQHNIQMPEVDSSQVILFHLQGKMQEPAKVASVQLQGIIIPDLLHYQETSSTVIVASNSHHTLQVLRVGPTDLTNIHEIKLSPDERPKGICSPHHLSFGQSEGALVVVGQPHNKDATFLSSSIREVYELRLQYIGILPECIQHGINIPDNLFKEIHLPNGNTQVHLLRINPLRSTETHEEDFSNKTTTFKGKASRPGSPNGELLLPTSGSACQPARSPKVQVMSPQTLDSEKMLDMDAAGFSDTLPNFKNKLKKFFEQKAAAVQHTMGEVNGGLAFPASRVGHAHTGPKSEPLSPSRLTPSPNNMPNSIGPCEASKDATLHTTFLETQVRTQACQIAQLQQRVAELSMHLEQSRKNTNKNYKMATSADVVFLVYKSSMGQETKKAFLLDNGLVKLDTIRSSFGLHTVELLIGDVPCVLGSDSEGYVPLLFVSNSTMYIGGRRSPPSTVCNHIGSMPKSDFNC